MNNRKKTQRELPITKKKRESDDKNAVAIVKRCISDGFVSRKTRSYWILKEAESLGEIRCKVLGPIRRIRFSPLRQASMSEKLDVFNALRIC